MHTEDPDWSDCNNDAAHQEAGSFPLTGKQYKCFEARHTRPPEQSNHCHIERKSLHLFPRQTRRQLFVSASNLSKYCKELHCVSFCRVALRCIAFPLQVPKVPVAATFKHRKWQNKSCHLMDHMFSSHGFSRLHDASFTSTEAAPTGPLAETGCVVSGLRTSF